LSQSKLPVKLRSEVEIMSLWESETNPVVSVICHTYQQENLLSDAIASFLIQETSFPFEIIIHEDASTDGTRAVIKKYLKRYPNIMRVILQNDNQFSQNNRPHIFTFPEARGEYIALCEGDDFWTSPHKLEKQVSLLRQYPDASGCFHRADDLDETSGKVIPARWSPPHIAEEYVLDDLLRSGNFFPTASLLFRKKYIGDPSELLKDIPHGDMAILSTLLAAGPLIFIDESMSVYRRHSGGIHSTVWGPISTFRALKSRVNIGNRLGLQNLVSYQVGLKKLHDELENKIFSDQQRIKHFETELQNVRDTYDRARQSRFFRLGVAIDRRLESIRSLMNRN
jgi:glycosyltransferase involved in cell wall biosynthesis